MMKTTIFILMLALSKFSVQAQHTYMLDVKKSKILWRMETIGKHYGDILFKSGRLNYSHNNPKDGNFILDMNTVRSLDGNVSGKKRVNAELRQPDFFGVEQFPMADIRVKQILPAKRNGIYHIIADLTIKGITKSITFDVLLKAVGKNLMATGKLLMDRRQWNIAYKPKPSSIFGSLQDKMMGGDIQIQLDLVFNRP